MLLLRHSKSVTGIVMRVKVHRWILRVEFPSKNDRSFAMCQSRHMIRILLHADLMVGVLFQRTGAELINMAGPHFKILGNELHLLSHYLKTIELAPVIHVTVRGNLDSENINVAFSTLALHGSF